MDHDFGEQTVGPVTTTKVTPDPYQTRMSGNPDTDLSDTLIAVSLIALVSRTESNTIWLLLFIP
jgi:hypothetical protein